MIDEQRTSMPDAPGIDLTGLQPPDAAAVAAAQKSAPGVNLAGLLPWIVLGVLVGLAAGKFDAAGILPWWLGRISLLPFLAGVGLSIWPHAVVHEAGHAGAGTLFGQRVHGAGIGPWRLERGQRGWHWRRGGTIRGISGFVVLAPREGRELGRADQAMYFLGGPLANLVTAALGWWALAGLDPAHWPVSMAWGAVVMALLLGVINLLPFRPGGWYSDGANLLQLLRGGDAARVRLCLSQWLGLSFMGVRPRDWPSTLAPRPVSAGLDPLLTLAHEQLHLLWAVDSGRVELADGLAGALAPRVLELPGPMQPALAVNLCAYIARCRPDAALLRAWLPWCERPALLDLSAQCHLLRAELAALEADQAELAAQLAHARQQLHKVHDAGSAIMLRERIDLLASGRARSESDLA